MKHHAMPFGSPEREGAIVNFYSLQAAHCTSAGML